MPTYKRYRHGRVSRIVNPRTGKVHEYRVGPVPPQDGIVGYQKNGKPIYVGKQLQGANYDDILTALGKIKTKFTIPVIYHRRTSQSRGFRWTSSERREVQELIHLVFYAKKNNLTVEDFAQKLFALDWNPQQVLAWNFVEVY